MPGLLLLWCGDVFGLVGSADQSIVDAAGFGCFSCLGSSVVGRWWLARSHRRDDDRGGVALASSFVH